MSTRSVDKLGKRFDYRIYQHLKTVFVLSVLISIFPEVRIGYAQHPVLNWSEDGERAWFELNEATGPTSYYLVDVPKRTKVKVFDSMLALEKLSSLTTGAEHQISELQFGKSSDHILVIAEDQKFRLDLGSGNVRKVGHIESKWVLFGQMKRSRNGARKEFRIRNSTSSNLRIHWIDYGGRKKDFGQIASGATRTLQTYERHVWLVEIEGKEIGYFEVGRASQINLEDRHLVSVAEGGVPGSKRSDKQSTPKYFQKRTGKRSPNGKIEVSVIGRNSLEVSKSKQSNTQVQEFMASEGFEFAGYHHLFWSPDSTRLVVLETKRVDTRKVHYIESSPHDALQPKLRNYSYPKPGDLLPVKRVRMFDSVNGTEIAIRPNLISNPFSIQIFGWSDDSSGFWLRYNQRGHQINRLVKISGNGETRSVVEEKSDTFIHYSAAGKSLFHLLPDQEFIWASERSGWNHLYRYSFLSGKLINPVTSGNWNFCSLERVDYERKLIWFFAYGVVADQDPYHKHLCRVSFDGTGFQVLTKGDGTHEIQFENDNHHFVDTFSRVDQAPISELRDSYTGELVVELRRSDTRRQFGARRLTERFVAKGRDGITDIWGVVHWPKNFDPEKKYPVVENIYAGPHGFHVPKKFRKSYYHQHPIADAGMIVVQIDGMGTAWRSKEFHDVCYKNLRDAGFPDRIAWMKSAARKFPQMDLSRVGIYGGSAGGQNAMAALLWHHDFYKVAVADCGCHDNRMDKIWWNEQWMGWPVDQSYESNSNTVNAHNLKGHLMLTLGELDRNVDPASTTQVVQKLIEADKDFEFVLIAGAGHGAGETPWAARKRTRFLSRHLQADQNIAVD